MRTATQLLTCIRAAIGLTFVACGASSLFDCLAQTGPSATPAGAFAFGGALLLAGSLLPLLKGVEVILETLLDVARSSRSPRGTPLRGS